ncbi:zinc finger FYVE domain-containing protein 1-like isoform X2 [Lycorma delicatula]|uniref:zinc finger FYVE domain-containing protein 1-like isoform X2 n=1 Tax=Lycorma delicatula TaxID=130591 RepID=UPI003F51268C
MELPSENSKSDVPIWQRFNFNSHSPAIMKSIDNPSIIALNRQSHDPSLESENHQKQSSLPDVTLTTEFTSLKLAPTNDNGNTLNSFLLLDGNEHLKVSSGEEFINILGCGDPSLKVKVVSIFGNTGDGKSYTLNQTFFKGEEVFRTSCEQDSCTLGVWAAYDPDLRVICLDTEGLLGTTSQENQRTRLLLKVLAVSDIVIYRTRSERLHSDLFQFLGSASRAYSQHFQRALSAVGQRGDFTGPAAKWATKLGPAVIIFQETRNTRTLHSSVNECPEDLLRSRFALLGLEMDAFSSVRYVGVKTDVPPTSFTELRAALTAELENTAVRSARNPCFVYTTLKVLNEKFSGAIPHRSEVLFPDQYFTCAAVCLSCEVRCQCSMGHISEGTPHMSLQKCRYQHQYGNIIYICKQCHTNGKEVVVTPQYTSSNDTSWFSLAKYVIECPNCGEIYRSRQFWYGNNGPEAAAVRPEIQHVWPGNAPLSQNTHNSAQRVLDGMTYITDAVASVGSQPTRVVSSWVADQIAPKYWKPNNEIKHCCVCRKYFSPDKTKHHCRACGDGVCDECSANERPVPERGWYYPSRVCDICFRNPNNGNCNETSVSSETSQGDDKDTIVRKCGEVVVNTLTSVASVLEHPKAWIKDSARPTYWVPDIDIRECCVCSESFCGPSGIRSQFHHCRDCGGGVCAACSTQRRPVPHRGWSEPVRVCDKCSKHE